jgi:hypothetical protein
MKTPHKHAELIKAWADGAEIEVLVGHKWVGVEENWTSYQNPFWYPDMKYRIKPEPKPDIVQHWDAGIDYAPCFTGVYNLILTFDGETGKLKSAEVLK